ncbi:MAG TPA: CsbD family protein [Burkholderiaceae bacterium]|nr:CsbD family protein [Burkholderiaceae bacterium]
MNKDQVKGAAKTAAGKVQEGAGKLVGSRTQEAKGLGKQAAGKAQKAMGDVKEAVKTKASTTRHH